MATPAEPVTDTRSKAYKALSSPEPALRWSMPPLRKSGA